MMKTGEKMGEQPLSRIRLVCCSPHLAEPDFEFMLKNGETIDIIWGPDPEQQNKEGLAHESN